MNFFLYLEGIRIPFSMIRLTSTTLEAAGLHPYAYRKLEPFTHVQLFSEYDGQESLLFDGFIVALSYSSFTCFSSFLILRFITIALVDPANYVLNTDATFSSHGAQVNLGLNMPILNPSFLLKGQKNVSNLFKNFYDTYVLGITEQSVRTTILSDFVEAFKILRKVYTIDTENAIKLINLGTFNSFLNGAFQSIQNYNLTGIDLLSQILNIFSYNLNYQISPTINNNLLYSTLLMPSAVFCSIPKCNLLSSPVIETKSISFSFDATKYPTRLILIGQLLSQGISVPLYIKPDSLFKAISKENLRDKFYQVKTDEESIPGRPIILQTLPIPSHLASILNSDESTAGKDEIDKFWNHLADHEFMTLRGSSMVISCTGGFSPYLMPQFPALLIDPVNDIFIGYLSSLSYSITPRTVAFSAVLSPLWDRTGSNPLFPDLNSKIEDLYKTFGTSVMPEEIPANVTTSQDNYFGFVKRKTTSISDFVNFMEGSGDQFEYTYPGMSENRKKKVRALLSEIRKR
ncbi:MAG: hypothetical protein QXP66_01765 [Candidatus Aenigmatarchaeota archaeon]